MPRVFDSPLVYMSNTRVLNPLKFAQRFSHTPGYHRNSYSLLSFALLQKSYVYPETVYAHAVQSIIHYRCPYAYFLPVRGVPKWCSMRQGVHYILRRRETDAGRIIAVEFGKLLKQRTDIDAFRVGQCRYVCRSDSIHPILHRRRASIRRARLCRCTKHSSCPRTCLAIDVLVPDSDSTGSSSE